jgi:hypothetical protein
MTKLSKMAIQISAVAIMEAMTTLENELAQLGHDHPDAACIGDELLQMVKVLGELHDAYLNAETVVENSYPSWDELQKQAGRRA